MALRFNVSAPGKVILSGEHSVVYGKAAIASVIDKRNSITLEANSKTHILLNFDLFPERKISIAVADFNVLLVKLSAVCPKVTLLPSEVPHDEFVEMVDRFLDAQPESTSVENVDFRRSCLAAMYLLAGNLLATGCQELHYGFTLTFQSGLPMGAGLGSSAAFGVCLATTFYFYSNYRLNANVIQQFNNASPTSEHRRFALTNISSWAFCSERIFHGNPSGLDNTICTFGQLVKFYKGQKPEPLPLDVPLEIVLINSLTSRSTRQQVEKVAELTRAHPQLMDSLMIALESVLEEIQKLLNVTNAAEARSVYPKLHRLININSDLLHSIGVSHPRLEVISRACEARGLASKLTGAGGGGYALALLPPTPCTEEEERSVTELCTELEADGFQWLRTIVGGDGVRIEELD